MIAEDLLSFQTSENADDEISSEVWRLFLEFAPMFKEVVDDNVSNTGCWPDQYYEELSRRAITNTFDEASKAVMYAAHTVACLSLPAMRSLAATRKDRARTALERAYTAGLSDRASDVILGE